ncbi:prenyltransferase/squalene oxidase repeat-containing protein [Fimbriiglobus ruber]|uniref:Geranylgeranyl transferase type II subunit beta n=1 Tax=Fimbriiglobus ruber TaxID=1908690 RepID=A0A225DFF3_9BACT|nr:prenyltransferase/squalene oxidase repeat-containing protein [Fimbriiglobus ruber]OWK35879.1 hypothetical protein FRUB_08442 [Fimbriiglobus ruber]
MRLPFAALLLFVPAVATAQTPEIDAAVKAKLVALKYVGSLQDAETGAFKADAKAKPGLRATSAAVRATKYLGGQVAHKDKIAEFVMKCYDPSTGAFADTPGGKADVPLTSVGVMAAVELDVPKTKFAKALTYLKDNAKTFEDVRIGAAAVEAWCVKDCPFDLAPWIKIADDFAAKELPDPKDGGARETGSVVAFYLRLGKALPAGHTAELVLNEGQRADGGWGKAGEKASDLETTYRVMRAFYLLKTKPKNVAGLRDFLTACHNTDGGTGAKAGDLSSTGGVYYSAIIQKWLSEIK